MKLKFLGSRKRQLVLGALAICALVPLVAVVSGGNDGAFSNSTPAKSLFALLSARSPGERTTAQLADTKPARGSKTVALTPPRQRALPKVQPAKATDDEFANLLLGMPDDALVPELAFLPPITTLELAPTGGGGGGGGGGCCGGGGGGGGGGGDDDPPPGDDYPPPGDDYPPPGDVPAVPEPGTWAMLMLGVFGCGSMLRRRPRGGLAASH